MKAKPIVTTILALGASTVFLLAASAPAEPPPLEESVVELQAEDEPSEPDGDDEPKPAECGLGYERKGDACGGGTKICADCCCPHGTECRGTTCKKQRVRRKKPSEPPPPKK